jgi:FMN phosphatase YigB (HAD superfamily)
MMSRLALFDLDDTLLDRESAFRLWAHDFIDRHNLSDSPLETIIRIDLEGDTPVPLFFKELRRAFGIRTSVGELVDQFWAVYPTCFEVPDSTYDALKRLRLSGWKLGVVTNGPLTQWKKIEATNLLPYFDGVCISGEIGVRKPDIGIFIAAAEQCGVALDGWMVGDSADVDIVGGHGAGLQTIWFPRGQAWESIGLAPDAIAVTVVEAVEIILG